MPGLASSVISASGISVTRVRTAVSSASTALAGKQAGRAAADEDRLHTPSPDQGQRSFEVGNQCRDVIALGNRAFRLVRVEVAVGALLYHHGMWM